MFPGVRQCIPDTNFGYGTIASNSIPAKRRFYFAVAASLQMTSYCRHNYMLSDMPMSCCTRSTKASKYKAQNKIKGFVSQHQVV